MASMSVLHIKHAAHGNTAMTHCGCGSQRLTPCLTLNPGESETVVLQVIRVVMMRTTALRGTSCHCSKRC
eukprot:scaffold384903_cov22-Prasinocladus_malaysianus.AAC.1